MPPAFYLLFDKIKGTFRRFAQNYLGKDIRLDSKKDIFVIVLIILSLGGIGLYDYLRRNRNKKEINKIEKS